MFRKTAVSVVALAISGALLAFGGQAVAAAGSDQETRPTAAETRPRPTDTRRGEEAAELRAERARQERVREAPAARPVRGDARFTG